jgi:hypothetical protein
LIPGEAAARIDHDLSQLRQGAPGRLRGPSQIEVLNVAETKVFAGGRLDQRKNRLAQRARLGEFGEAPFAVEPVFGQNQNDRFGPGDFAIECALPVGARSQSGVLVEVEKGFSKTMRMQAGSRAPPARRPGLSG